MHSLLYKLFREGDGDVVLFILFLFLFVLNVFAVFCFAEGYHSFHIWTVCQT